MAVWMRECGFSGTLGTTENKHTPTETFTSLRVREFLHPPEIDISYDADKNVIPLTQLQKQFSRAESHLKRILLESLIFAMTRSYRRLV